MTQVAPQPVHTGQSTPHRTPAPAEPVGRRPVFLHAVAFVLGFGAVFTLLGSAAGQLGRSLNEFLPVIQRLGAILLIVFGLITIGVFSRLSAFIRQRTDLAHNPAAAALVSILDFFTALLYTEKRVSEMHNVNRRWGYLSSALLGVSFSAFELYSRQNCPVYDGGKYGQLRGPGCVGPGTGTGPTMSGPLTIYPPGMKKAAARKPVSSVTTGKDGKTLNKALGKKPSAAERLMLGPLVSGVMPKEGGK